MAAFPSLILQATDREAVRPVVVVHVGIATVEVQVPCVGSIHCTAPIVTVATHIVEGSVSVVAVARQGKINISYSHHKTKELILQLHLLESWYGHDDMLGLKTAHLKPSFFNHWHELRQHIFAMKPIV